MIQTKIEVKKQPQPVETQIFTIGERLFITGNEFEIVYIDDPHIVLVTIDLLDAPVSRGWVDLKNRVHCVIKSCIFEVQSCRWPALVLCKSPQPVGNSAHREE